MQLHQYLAQAEKQYHLRLKTIVPLDDAAMERIEMVVAKYLPLFIARPKKTILQRQPMEFPEVRNAEVYIVDMSFGLPVAPHVIRDDVRTALEAPDSFVFVRNQYSPGELEIERLNAIEDIDAEAAAKGLKLVATLDDEFYNEADGRDNAALFGNAYNAAFLSYLSTVQKEREEKVAKTEQAPFLWLDLPDRADSNEQDGADFNADIPDAPRVAPQGITTPEVNHSILGHYRVGGDNEVRRLFTDDKGNRVILARKLFVGDDQ
jgi:hypothetical protein